MPAATAAGERDSVGKAKRPTMLTPFLALQLAGAAAPGAPDTAPSRVHSVALFKNGLAWVRASAEVSGAAPVVVGPVPEAVHGTFWLRSDSPVTARSTEIDVEIPFDGSWEHDPQRVLAGARVEVHLRGMDEATSGVVIPAPARDAREWSRDFEAGRTRPWWQHGLPGGKPNDAASPARFLGIQEGGGATSYLPLAEIQRLRVIESPPSQRELRPGLVLTAAEGTEAAEVGLSYLTKGLSWAPSYRLDLRPDGLLHLTQAAVIRNELGPLTDVEFELVTGFPNMPLSHVLSPLAPGQDWASFFRDIGQSLSPGSGGALTQMLSNRATVSTPSPQNTPGADEGVDLSYRSIGRHTLGVGDALQVETAAGETGYERIVEWKIEDERDSYGRVRSGHSHGDAEEHDPWDALRFRNPLDFPMTTAPATMTDGGRFLGEQLVEWTAPGGEVTVPVTKALSIATKANEYEVEESRETVYRWGDTYRQSFVRGELELVNRRSEAVRVVIRRELSGVLEEADGSPASRLLGEGAYQVNPRRELLWELDLKPGETRKLEYRYGLLVRR